LKSKADGSHLSHSSGPQKVTVWPWVVFRLCSHTAGNINLMAAHTYNVTALFLGFVVFLKNNHANGKMTNIFEGMLEEAVKA
jgi:hypothetical protein